MIRAGSQNARLLDVLADGQWHLSRELHERAGYMRTNSRISELRAHGHVIEGQSVPGRTGTDGYRYRLVASPVPLSEPALLQEPVTETTGTASGGLARGVGTGSWSGEQLTLEDAA